MKENLKDTLLSQAMILSDVATCASMLLEYIDNEGVKKAVLEDMTEMLHYRTGERPDISGNEELVGTLAQLSAYHFLCKSRVLKAAIIEADLTLTPSEYETLNVFDSLIEILSGVEDCIQIKIDGLYPNYVVLQDMNEPWFSMQRTIKAVKELNRILLAETEGTVH